jgi:cytochrome c556
MKNKMRLSMLSIAILFGSFAANAAMVNPSDSAKDAAIYSHIITRVNEIQSMDKTTLTDNKKAELRKELKQMKKQAGGLDKRVYLSIGAIIIIILLLILIL